MRCQRCELENIPGLEKCMRCGTALIASKTPVEMHPPRMSRWKKPFRSLQRKVRRSLHSPGLTHRGARRFGFPTWLGKVSRVTFFGAFASLIPGLAHYLQRRFGMIRWWVLGWFLLLFTALFLYGSILGMIGMGLALGVHVWIAAHAALLDEYDEFSYRAMGFLITLVFYYVLYLAVGRVIFYDVQGGYSVISVPSAAIYQNDFLLGRPSRAVPEILERGSFVLVRLSHIGEVRRNSLRRSLTAYVQVIGLGNDSVAVQEGLFVVNGQIQDAQRFPVPNWLKNQTFSTRVPEGSYFISAEYQGVGYNEQQILTVCVVPLERIEAKAVLRWMPLGRRGFIAEFE